MANLSDYAEEAQLDALTTGMYAAIFDDSAIDAELEAGTLTNEITGYDEAARPAITWGSISQVSDKATRKNSAVIDFTVMPAVTVKYVCVMDSTTKGAGNILFWCPLSAQKTCNAGDTFRVPINGLTVDLA